jgi:hypothetical protein
MLGGDEEIALVLAVVVVGHDDKLAAGECRDHVLNAAMDVVQFSLPLLSSFRDAAKSAFTRVFNALLAIRNP